MGVADKFLIASLASAMSISAIGNSWSYSNELPSNEESFAVLTSIDSERLSKDFNPVSEVAGYFRTGSNRLRTPGSKVDTIVIHYTATLDFDKTVDGFQSQRKPRASSHFLVNRDGKVYRFVEPSKYAAFHVGPSYNDRSIGIEIMNCGYLSQENKICADGEKTEKLNEVTFPKDELIDRLNESWLGFRPSQKQDVFKHNWFSWERFSLQQMESVARLTRYLMKEFDIAKERVVPHCNVQDGKFDVGPAFDYQWFEQVVFKDNFSASCDLCYDFNALPPELRLK